MTVSLIKIRKFRMDPQNPFTLPMNSQQMRPSIFDGVINVNMNVDNMAGEGANLWAQVPPQTMPWSTPADQLPDVVRFTGDADFNCSFPQTSAACPKTPMFHKRKSSDMGPRPPKVLITEEAMALQLKNMYISNKMEEINGNMGEAGNRFPAGSNNEEELPTLTMCPEIKNMSTPVYDPILPVPRTLWEKMEKPTKALVLWRPPRTFLSRISREAGTAHKAPLPPYNQNELNDETAMED